MIVNLESILMSSLKTPNPYYFWQKVLSEMRFTVFNTVYLSGFLRRLEAIICCPSCYTSKTFVSILSWVIFAHSTCIKWFCPKGVRCIWTLVILTKLDTKHYAITSKLCSCTWLKKMTLFPVYYITLTAHNVSKK